MPFASVTIQVTKNATPAVARWRQDATAGSVMSFALSNTTGVNSYQWLLWRPEGSGAGGAGIEPISLGTSPTANITVDLKGTYIVWCMVNAGAVDATIIRGGCAYLESFSDPMGRPLRLLGPFETNEDQADPLIQQEETKMLNRWLQTIGGGGTPSQIFHVRQIASDYDGTGRTTSGANVWSDCADVLAFTTGANSILVLQAVVSGTVAAKNVKVFARITMDGNPLPTSIDASAASSDGGPVNLSILCYQPLNSPGPHDFHLEISSSTTDGFSEAYGSDHTQGARLVVTELGLDDGGETGPIGPAGPAGPAGPGSSDVATWDITKVRYIFLDGDSGNDANIGYIDDAPGTDFTSRAADVAAVAIKTTSRLEAITPKVGAGRMMVRLYKPRVGGAAYDHATLGDGLGKEDRSVLSGYTIISRGSDLTNSPADKLKLGFVNTAFPGGNGDGSWTVGTVGSSPEGVVIQLVGATVPSGASLTYYRLRWVHAGVTYYASVRWADTGSGAADTLTAWSFFGSMGTGDHAWLEQPGAKLKSFYEAASGSGNQTVWNVFAGVQIVTTMAIGHSEDSSRVDYTNILAGLIAVTQTRRVDTIVGCPTVVLNSIYVDEQGQSVHCGGFGIVAGRLVFNGGNFWGAFSSFVVSAVIAANYISLFNSTVNMAFLTGVGSVALADLNHGAITLQPSGPASVVRMRGVTAWSPSVVMQPLGASSSVSFSNMHNLLHAFEVPSEPTAPGIVLTAGQYTAVLDFGNESIPGTISCGNGVRVQYNTAGDQFGIVTYDSLKTTGFEVVGGQRVICKATGAGTGYTGDVLPCPRGVPMKIVNFPGSGDSPAPTPCGLVVVGVTATGGQQAAYLSLGLAPQNIIGVALTPYANNADMGGGNTGGWVVVGNDSMMVLRKDSLSAFPGIGVPVFASFHDEFTPGLTGGCSVTEAQPDLPTFRLGSVLPIGTPTTGINIPVAWDPSRLRSQTRSAWSSFSKTSDTTLSSVPGLFCIVEAGVTYNVQGRLHISTGSGVNNGGVKLALTGDATATTKCNLLLEFVDFVASLIVSLSMLTSTGDASYFAYGGTSSSYDIIVNGSFVADTSGNLYLRFGQSASKPVASQILSGSLVVTRAG